MARQYKRAIRLVVGSGSGETLDLSNMRIVFKVRQNTVQSPNNAEIRIYNLAKSTAAKVRDEFQTVQLDAGYEENIGTIFKGELVYKRTGRENPVDTYLDLFARDGDKGYNFGVVNKSLAPGSTHRDHVNAFLDALKPFGISEGAISGLGDVKYPRTYTFFGPVREHLRRLAATVDASWSIQNGKLDIVPNKSEGKGGGAIVLNSNTGLISMPVETLNGIMVTALINPEFKVNGQVQIDEKSIQRGAFSLNYGGEVQNSMLQTLGTADGTYRILAVDWEGDSRGADWYAFLTCIGSKTGVVPTSQAGQGRG